jgi:undecaprenyl pyrophosphate phosphatase UppP
MVQRLKPHRSVITAAMLVVTEHLDHTALADVSGVALANHACPTSELIAAGFAAAFLAASFTLRFAIAFVVKYGFAPFAYYRITIGSVLLLLQSI